MTFLPLKKLKGLQLRLLPLFDFLVTEQNPQVERNVRRGARRQYGMSQLRENPTGSFTANAESAQSWGLFGIP